MRKQSPETQLRHAKSALKKAQDDTRKANGRVASMLIGVTFLHKLLSVTRGALPKDDPWRPHFVSWIEDLELIRKEGLRP